MNTQAISSFIESGRASLGMELGSTRIKAVLIGPDFAPIAQGSHSWENKLEDGIWTYALEDAVSGMQDAYAALASDVERRYGVKLRKLAGLGVSAMMHGYLAFDANDNLLVPFRTWRNTITAQAAAELSQAFSFNIPQRWSIAHLHQALLSSEPHVGSICFLTTLAGYIHWRLSGRKVLGLDDASGMFPVDPETKNYDERMLGIYDSLVANRSLPWKLRDLLPQALDAGADAGVLTEDGAKLLDPTGTLDAGSLLAPPEGDAATGMVATNSIAKRTGNVSAGTSIFAMAVLEKPLAGFYPELDVVATPDGAPVAMVHCNNCASDLDAWLELLIEGATALGAAPQSKGAAFDTLYAQALRGDPDCGGLVSIGYLSGEPVAGVESGRPLFVRKPDAKPTLPNFIRALVSSTMATLKIGMDILVEKEGVALDSLMGHGGLFKARGVAQKIMAGALGVPVTCLETAGEGGPWGMALLAAYRALREDGESLAKFLSRRVFSEVSASTIPPDEADAAGFAKYLSAFKAALAAEKAAVAAL